MIRWALLGVHMIQIESIMQEGAQVGLDYSMGGKEKCLRILFIHNGSHSRPVWFLMK